jgi:glycosyltransferase involved in cell wall biosynthesis
MDDSKVLRILILAPGSNPESISTSLVGYSHGAALARLHSVTLVAGHAHEVPLRRAPASFHEIVTIKTPWIDALSSWLVHTVFKGDYGSQVMTALGYPLLLIFEWKAWRHLKARIRLREYDVVLRLLPVVPVLPSLFPFLLRGTTLPFVIGPINGGLPWPKGFIQAEKQKEWISNFRNLYRFLPFARSTYENAAAIIAGSSHTYAEFARYQSKMFFIPENGLTASLLGLELFYVGRLVPYKSCDIALQAAAALLKKKLARMTIVGDGPERSGLERLTRELGIDQDVRFEGWLSHDETMKRLGNADVLIFPSIREFGGGVVFEALALGVVPVVVDYGGPGDTVHPEVGYKVTLTNEKDMILKIENILSILSKDRQHLARLQGNGMTYAKERLSWEGKAKDTTRVLLWAVDGSAKPDLPPPKMFSA